MKKKKSQKSKLKTLKKKAWAIFSEYIRRKEHGVCYTCGLEKDWSSQHAGHFRHNKLDFDEMNIHCQCLTKDSKLLMHNGRYKNISDIKVGDKLLGFDKNSFKKEFSFVENIGSFVPEELYEIELENGKKFYATYDHMVVANKKWVSIHDMLHNFTAYDILEL